MVTKNKILGSIIVAGAIFALVVGFRFFVYTPKTLTLAVPFSPQAPFGNWDNNEDCEETSLLMAQAYLNGRRDSMLSPNEIWDGITMLNDWEDKNLGHREDTGADETAHMATEVLGLKVQEIPDYTEADLKSALARGHVVLLSLSARLLGNPQYKDAGPLYHMIVVRGYTDKGFVVNDPGTENGAGVIYTFDILKNAARDWDSASRKLTDRKVALILSK